jgi:parallel beta-helix repeat protein
MKKYATSTIVLILCLVTTAPLSAATLSVPSQYPNIQEAIYAANNGDTIIIAPGTYSGLWKNCEIYFDKAITVQSTDPNDPNIVAATVIDCNDAYPNEGFSFVGKDANSILDGLTIINGSYGITCHGSAPTIRNCVISNCDCGIDCFYSAPTIRNCVIKNCNLSGGIFCCDGLGLDAKYYPQIINCIISHNSGYNGGGICFGGGSPLITNCTINNNTADNSGGGIYFWGSGNPVITNSVIRGNYAGKGGGIYSADFSSANNKLTLINCIIGGNQARIDGGGIWALDQSLINCVISSNHAQGDGGGIYSYGALDVSNCTISANVAGQPGSSRIGGGIYYNFRKNPHGISIINSIVWGNLDYYATGETDQIGGELPLVPEGPVYIAFNCIQDSDPNDDSIPFNDDPVNQNIDDNPKFVHEPNIVDSEFGDLHLQKDSPCINTGDPNYIPEPNETDLDGNPRVIGARIDMGAYEFVPDTTPPDFELSVSPTILWPANHKMVKIIPTCVVTDLCDPSPQVSLVDITANEPVNPNDIQILNDGSIYLCATRSGNSKTGRIYSLIYQACDSSDNCTTRSATVIVPHDMRK